MPAASRRRTVAWTLRFVLAAALAAAVARPARAQPVDVPDTWGGDWLSRPRFTGSWGGVRDELGKRGVVLDADLILTPQGNVSGGRNVDGEFWGNAEYTLNVDTQKLGLWPGGFLRVIGNTGMGNHVLADIGAVGAANTGAFLPTPRVATSALMQATFAQFLSTKFGLVAGKINTLDSDGEFTGNYRTQFMNLGLVVPMAAALVPISAYGGGVIGLPWDGVVLAALTIDPDGTPTSDDLTDAFRHGVMELGTAHVKVSPFGLLGHQSIGFMWSDRQRLSLIQDPSNLGTLLAQEHFPLLQDPGPVLERILKKRFPGLLNPTQPPNTESDAWSVFYSFDQYLWQPAGDSSRGLGMFFSFGLSDGDANPVRYSYTLGLGGNGIVPGRPHDNFGVGWSAIDFSGNFVPFLRSRLDIGFDREDAVEMYYNAALTGWLNVTADVQVINPGLGKTLASTSGTQLEDVHPAVVVGVRTYIRF